MTKRSTSPLIILGLLIAFILGMVTNHYGEDKMTRTVQVYNKPVADQPYATEPPSDHVIKYIPNVKVKEKNWQWEM